ncbi:MAG TPA: aldo/keto reductase, partial [Candidatus Hydrogenedentes bacterium]|nr:aldo/keto reductase [Candidatus Hydrogenedentota bacterium]
MEYRRFGKTELQIPVISCGGMRFQQGWKEDEPIAEDSQRNVEACVRRSLELGINHVETARGYGTSEMQLGKILPTLPRDQIIVQTKVGPKKEVKEFIDTFEKSMSLLRLDYIDLFSFHGINDEATLEATLACLDTAQQWKREGRIRDIGFSTHGGVEIVRKAIEQDVFEHVNLHWYFIYQDHWENILEARRRDMGVFIISPNDKAGMLYRPSEKLLRLCEPLHPMVFNGLFCLARPEVHTLSCGVARPEDFDIHMETVRLLPRARETVAPIERRLREEMARVLGEDWAATWDQGLPRWHEAPGEVNIEWILRLRNLVLAFDMLEYAKMRYNLLG